MSALLIGSDVTGGTLRFEATPDRSGKLLFGTSGYDEVNDRLGILTDSPGFDIHVKKNSASPSARIQVENAGGNAFFTSVSTLNTSGAHLQVENAASDNLGGWATLSAFGGSYVETYHFGQEDAGNTMLSCARGSMAIGTLTAKDLYFGTNNTERFRIEDASGLLKLGATMFVPCGTNTVVLGDTGPDGASATPIEWLLVKNPAGELRRIPAF